MLIKNANILVVQIFLGKRVSGQNVSFHKLVLLMSLAPYVPGLLKKALLFLAMEYKNTRSLTMSKHLIMELILPQTRAVLLGLFLKEFSPEYFLLKEKEKEFL